MGNGCPSCAGKRILLFEDFIERANTQHYYKYNYDFITKIDFETRMVPIMCPVLDHGIFYQRVHGHLSGKGCIKCSGNKKYSNNEYITMISIKYNNFYDYSLVKYDGIFKK
jgi:hypothetical protein